MGKIIGRILAYSVYVLAPALSVHLGQVTMTEYDENPEQIIAGILIGILFNFFYSIALLIIYRKSEADRIINIVIALLCSPAVVIFASVIFANM